MNDPTPSHSFDLSPSVALKLDRVCTRFELAWKAGERPRIEDFLAGHEDTERGTLLRELVALEVFHRRRLGETPSEEDYRDRFPELAVSPLAETLGPPDDRSRSVGTWIGEGKRDGFLPTVGGYEVLREIARGGMGVVYKARQQELNRLVALKMILPGQLVTTEAVQRFRTEAANVARLEHDHIVPIYEIGEYQGQPFFTMKLIEGGSLDQRTADFLRDPRKAARMLAIVARAVHHAHQHGLIHRDLKPSNILLDLEDQPHVTDFGLAKRLEASIDLTRSNAIVGTPCYMAPEQAAGKQKEVSTATDVYGLGAILYELLAGRPPFKADTPLDTLMQVLHDEPVPPRQLQTGVPRDLEVICLKCLSKEQERRYASALALAEDLVRWLEGTPITARAVTTWERGVRWVRRHPAPAGLIVVSFLASLALVGALVARSYNVELERINVQLVEEKEEADRQRTRAKESEAKARESEATTRRFNYVTRMTQAEQARKAGNTGRMLQLLRSVIPESSDQEDLRGWEWHHLWRTHQGEQSRLRGHSGPITSVAFSPDDRLLASASEDSTVRLWSTITGKEMHCLKGHTGSVNCVAFSVDGKRVASAGEDRTIRIWDPSSGEELQRLDGHEDRVTCIVFCPRTGGVVSASHDKSVRLWNRDGKLTRNYASKNEEPFQTVAVSPDGKRIVCGSQGVTFKTLIKGEFVALNAESGDVIDRSNQLAISLAFSPDGKLLARCPLERMRDGQMKETPPVIELLDGVTLNLARSLKGHTAQIAQVAFSMDGKTLVSGSHDQTVRVWDVQEGKVTATFHEDGPVLTVAVSPDGLRFASGSEDGVVKVWASSQPGPRVLKGGGGGVAFSPDGLQLAASQFVRDIRSGESSSAPKGHGHGRVCWSSDGRYVACDGYVWEAKTGQQISKLPNTGKIMGMALSPDGSLVAETGKNYSVALSVWETRTGRLIRSLPFGAWVIDVGISPDGRWIAGGAAKNEVGRSRRAQWLKVWELTSGKEARVLDGFIDCVFRVRFSPDGQYLAAAIGDHWASRPGEVRVWKVGTWELVWRLRGHQNIVYSVAFSPDRRRLVSGGGKGGPLAIGKGGPFQVKVWDLTTGQEVWELPNMPEGQPHDVAFSPCGRRLAVVGSGNGGVLLFDGTPLAESPAYQPLPDSK